VELRGSCHGASRVTDEHKRSGEAGSGSD
jgi:hypothetical protein